MQMGFAFLKGKSHYFCAHKLGLIVYSVVPEMSET